MKNKFSFFILLCFVFNSAQYSQNLLKKLDSEFRDQKVYEIATFKTTRIGLGHSIETRKKGALQFSLYNRYWNIPDFKGQRFLADVVSTRYGLEYAFTDNFTSGIGYTNYDEITDGYLKYKLVKQQRDSKKSLVSITLLQAMSHKKINTVNPYQSSNIEDEYAFTSQVLIARKINPNLSLQIAPTYISRSTNSQNTDPSNQFAIGFGGRHKINEHTTFVSEYYYLANPLKSIETYNAFMVGINWEVSGLMLQFHLTNARSFAEDTFITRTTNNFNFKDGNLHFGFNATLILHTKKNKL